jgi:hypothetical protein
VTGVRPQRQKAIAWRSIPALPPPPNRISEFNAGAADDAERGNVRRNDRTKPDSHNDKAGSRPRPREFSWRDRRPALPNRIREHSRAAGRKAREELDVRHRGEAVAASIALGLEGASIPSQYPYPPYYSYLPYPTPPQLPASHRLGWAVVRTKPFQQC